MTTDPRFNIHNVTVQGLPSTTPHPKKKLSHTVKAVPSARTAGTLQPIKKRVALFVRKKRHHRR